MENMGVKLKDEELEELMTQLSADGVNQAMNPQSEITASSEGLLEM